MLDKLYIVSFITIALSTLVIQLAIHKNIVSLFIGRKILHLIAITGCAYVIYYSNNLIGLSYLFLLFSFLLFILVYKNIFESQHGNSYGIALFPLAFFILLQSPFLHRNEIVFAVLTLAFSDALAGLFGFYFGRKKIKFLYETKSWLGLFVFFFTTIIIYYTLFKNDFELYKAIIIALIPSLAELFSYKGSDNVTVPIITAYWVYILHNSSHYNLFFTIILINAFAILAVFTVRKKWLTTSGATAAFFIGTIILPIYGLIYLTPLIIFFIGGSLASKLNKDIKEKNGRNAIQVFANGIIAVVCLFIFKITHQTPFLIGFLASIAISMSDTLSSEVGKFFKQPTYDILNFQKTTVGLSGGISIVGTIAGLLASIFYSYIICFIFKLSMQNAIIIASIGFIGMLMDSVLGSFLQAKYRNSNNEVVEQKTTELIKGYRWCTNDMVNVLSNCVMIIFLLIFYFNS